MSLSGSRGLSKPLTKHGLKIKLFLSRGDGKEAKLKNQITLPAYGSTCKELGSHNSILTSKKLERLLKINNSSWIQKRGEYTGQTTTPKIGETGKNTKS